MTIRQATVIPYCEECRTNFAIRCRHATGKAAVVWRVDPIPDQELP